MNSKNLAKRLYSLGYTLNRYPLGGWMIVSVHTGFEYRFPTLEGVNRFVVDEEAMGLVIVQ
jgi:hypothetical protein